MLKRTLLFSLNFIFSIYAFSFQVEIKNKFFINGEPTLTGPEAGMFQDTEKRLKIDLSGKWLVREKKAKEWIEIPVPSAYDLTAELVFRRTFNLADSIVKNFNLILVSYGINYKCEIFLNGQFLARHSGGYSSFTVRIPERMLNSGENVLELQVDNHLNAKSTIPLRHQVWGWRNYGGIYRDIYILATPKIWVDDVAVKYSLTPNYLDVNGEIETYISTLSIPETYGRNFSFKVQIVEKSTGALISETQPVQFYADDFKSIKVKAPFSIKGVRLWSPQSPSLYILRCLILKDDEVIDQFDLTTGFREVKISNGDIFLNGERLILKGVSRHEDHPNYGNALTYAEMERDIILIKNLGANAIRLAHYPAHPYILNLCDRYGLLVLEEIPVWNVPADILIGNAYISLAKDYIAEMINRDRNHPSVFAWGIGNEFDSANEKAKKYVTELVKFVKSIDDRPVYYASRMIRNDVCVELVDLACVNVYIDEIEKFIENIRFWKQKYSHKPVIITEYGKAVQVENRNGYMDPLSYESQAKYILERYKIIQEENYDGSFVWVFADWRGDRPVLTLPNPDPYLYSMGLVSYHRERRPAYDVLKALYTEGKIPTLTIGEYSESVPAIFTIAGILLLLFLSYIYYSSRWFRENLNRAILRPYNFFADIRDQHLISTAQTTILAIIISATLGVFWAGILNRLKQNEFLDYILTHLIFSDFLKAKLVTLIWDPLLLTLYFSAFYFVIILLVALTVQMFSAFVRASVLFHHSYSVVVWSLLPITLLIPIDMILFKVVTGFETVFTVIGIALVVYIISFARLIKGMAIIYEVRQTKIAFACVGFVLLILGLVAVYYNYRFSTLAYLKFLIDILNSTK